MVVRRNKRREIKQTLIDLVELTNSKPVPPEITEELIERVLIGQLHILFENNKVYFQKV